MNLRSNLTRAHRILDKIGHYMISALIYIYIKGDFNICFLLKAWDLTNQITIKEKNNKLNY